MVSAIAELLVILPQ